MFDFYRMEDLIKPETKVICRIDINSPLDKKKNISGTWRFQAHKETLRWLIKNQNAVILLAHQGRPGDEDFTDLSKHAEVLSDVLTIDVKFVPDVVGDKALNAIKNIKPGEIILLDNVRKVPDEMKKRSIEEHSKSLIVKTLSPHAEYFVLDGFSVAHRHHASVIGFPARLPSAAGLLFEKEINELSKFLRLDEYNFIFGGAKVSDVIKSMLLFSSKNKKIRIFLTGLTALVFHYAKGLKLPKTTEELILKKAGKYLDQIKEILEKTDIYFPIDYALDKNGSRIEVGLEEISKYNLPPKDIGEKTVEYYAEQLKNAHTVFIKGPAGVIEEEAFRIGSQRLLEELARQDIFLVFFGGHLSSILEHSQINPKKYYISTGGGSSIQFLANGTLPGIEALEYSRKIFK